MSFKCVHISDIHFRGLSRHEEYRESFDDFFKKIKKLEPDLIFVGGDIVHSKTQGISPELIDILNWWFTSMAEIAPTHIILGNHDGLISNKYRQDAISPIINALDPKGERLHLYKDSGTYPTGIPGFNWCVFSCFDEENWPNVKPIEGEINIALFHGGVYGSTTDINWDIDGEVKAEFFSDFDFAFLGDIHRFQYLDKDKKIAYPGSPIQQNYGEDPGKGFIYWEIEDNSVYRSRFIPIKHNFPFVTIDWKGTVMETVSEASKFNKGSRFRIRSNFAIPQAEIKHLYSELQEKLDASEIVFKFDSGEARSINQSSKNSSLNLRDHQNISSLLKQYYKDQNIKEAEWEKIEELLKKYCHSISKNDPPRNVKWSIKKMDFENMFAYGKGNVINFENLSGIVGVFGKNRSGKSSIPGSIMYGLFNSTDRGPIKNLHIINSRKGHCRVAIDFSVNGTDYRVDRQSVKHQNRKGEVGAVTQLNFFELDPAGNPTRDMSGEQRRETDKILRDIIGTREDFLLTSFASQGEMNTFIKNKATQRKSILANFLDLDIFDKITNLAKEDSISIKALLDRAPEREWNTLILEKGLKLRAAQEERETVEARLNGDRQRLQTLKVEAAQSGAADITTFQDIINQENKIRIASNRLESINLKLSTGKEEIEETQSKINKISDIKSQFPIEELREKVGIKNELEKTLLKIENTLDKEKSTLIIQKKSVNILETVPCADKFPSCKFIKDSHKNKKLLESQNHKIAGLKSDVAASRRSLRSLISEDLENKILRYRKILDQENELKLKKLDLSVATGELEREEISLTESLILMRDELSIMRPRVTDADKCGELNELKKTLHTLEQSVRSLDAKRMSLSENIGLLTSSLSSLESEKSEYDKLLSEWRIYELIMNAVSKKGIPTQILSTQLPGINEEISKILQGVAGFTVELEADKNSNAMDIYINYGDSRRIIECASGMEKMVSSLAIRVALINVSSLPKCDTLVIDEGFGTLDEINVEACNRLLSSLKRWFRNILVISHVDAVKDSVDMVLDITNEGKNSKVVYE